MSYKTDDLERKVESLVKYLENERRLRFEAEAQIKSQVHNDKDQLDKMLSLKERVEVFNHIETELKNEIEHLQYDKKDLKNAIDGLFRQLEVAKSDKIEL